MIKTIEQDTNCSENYIPKVTILLATYNRLALLKEALESALNQDYSNFDILVVDDGSDAETRNWLRAHETQNTRLRVIFQDHGGVAMARANGVAMAEGDWVCILDSDDTLASNSLSKLVEEAARHSDRVIFHTSVRELRPSDTVNIHTYPGFDKARNMLWAIFLHPRVPFKHSGTFFRREVALKLGSYNSTLPCKVDIDFYLRFIKAGHCPMLVDEPLVNFRMHKNSVSRNRLLGLKVWFRLIDTYAPGNVLVRSFLKILRAGAECFKGLYIELRG